MTFKWFVYYNATAAADTSSGGADFVVRRWSMADTMPS